MIDTVDANEIHLFVWPNEATPPEAAWEAWGVRFDPGGWSSSDVVASGTIATRGPLPTTPRGWFGLARSASPGLIGRIPGAVGRLTWARARVFRVPVPEAGIVIRWSVDRSPVAESTG